MSVNFAEMQHRRAGHSSGAGQGKMGLIEAVAVKVSSSWALVLRTDDHER